MKKSIILILFIIVIATILTGAVFLYSDKNTTDTPSTLNSIFPTIIERLGLMDTISISPPTKTTESEEKFLPTSLTQLVREPVASAVSLPIVNASSSLVFIRKDNGHIYRKNYNIRNNTFDDSVLLSNITTTNVTKASFATANNNLHVIINYQNNSLSAYKYLIINLNEPLTNIRQMPLEDNIKNVIQSPDLNKLLLVQYFNNKLIGIILDTKTNTRIQAFTLPNFTWQIQWLNPSLITLQTKSSPKTLGYLYHFNPSTGTIEKIIGETIGLTTLTDPTGENILTVKNQPPIKDTLILNKITKQTTSLPFDSIPDKCIWDKSAIICQKISRAFTFSELDKWYKGEIKTTGGFWEYGVTTEEFYELATSKEKLDAIDLTLDQKNNIVYFKNKNDDSLWSLDLNLARY